MLMRVGQYVPIVVNPLTRLSERITTARTGLSGAISIEPGSASKSCLAVTLVVLWQKALLCARVRLV